MSSLYRTLLGDDLPGAVDHYACITAPTVLHIQEDGKRSMTIEDAHSHLVIIVDAGVAATVGVVLGADVESHAQEIFLNRHAHLTIATLSHPQMKDAWIAQRTKIDTDAQIVVQNATAGGERITHDLVSAIEGDHGESTVEWLFRSRGKESAMLTARNVFAARGGGGEMTMKGIAEGKGSVKVDGMIDIRRHGTGTDTYLTQDVLMLDPTAKVDAIPGLEIGTNDVKASHSATVSRVTADDLFYFAARGIEESVARAMYIEGYLSEYIEKIPHENMREEVQRRLFA